jgi:hypothetical protein
LIAKREKYLKDSFNQELIDNFVDLYKLDDAQQKLYTLIWLSRDIF